MNPVPWDDAAYDEVADMWVRATPDERDRIEAAVNLLNARLRRDPLGQGESRGGNRRLAFFPPLAVLYRVNPDGSSPYVLHVARYGG
jgi:hypothetical protein